MKTALLFSAGLACARLAVAQVVLAKEQTAVSHNADTYAEKVQVSTSPPLVPEMQAEQQAIGPGRYLFTILAGASGTKGYVDGNGAVARFDNPGGIAVDAVGNVYVSEQDLCIIRKISPDGVVGTLAGAAGQRGSQDGVGSAARFNQPRGVAVDGAGNVYVAEIQNHTVRKIDSSGNVTTFAGTAGVPGSTDGARGVARLNTPGYVAVDDAGNVFVTEPVQNWPGGLRKITPDGSVSTPKVSIPYNLSDYSYIGAWELCVDHVGTLYVIYSDAWDFIDAVKLTPTAEGGYSGKALRPPSPRSSANGLGVDDADNLYVKYDLNSIYKFGPEGGVEVRHASGNDGEASWDNLAVDRRGRLFCNLSKFSGNGGTIDMGVFDPGGIAPVILVSNNVPDRDAGFYSVVVTDRLPAAAASRGRTLSRTSPPPDDNLPDANMDSRYARTISILRPLRLAGWRRT